MGFKHLTPLTHTALLYNQTGSVFVTKNNADVTGSVGGFEGIHTQEYLEILAGNECIPSSIWASSSDVTSIASNGTFWTVSVNEETSAQAGNIVQIRGTTNYNGNFEIAAVAGDKMSIKITNTDNPANEAGLSASIRGITKFTSSHNTTGTMYFPEIEYFTGFKNYSVYTSGNILELEMSANSINGDDYAKNGIYRPGGIGSTANNYVHIYHGDEVFGKFNRIAIFIVASTTQRGRLRILKGPSLN